MTDNNKNCFYKSRFLDKSIVVSSFEGNQNLSSANLNIAIHAHVFYIEILDEIINHLKDCPYSFDLLISVCSDENQNICKKMITKIILPNLGNIIIKVVENRGRDVAPWVIAFGKEQAQYDLVCHIHTKYSPTAISIGFAWRQYLYNNLISSEAISNIVLYFKNNEKLGLMFPPFFSVLYHHLLEINNSFLSDIDKLSLQNLLDSLSIKQKATLSNTFFPPGTMFWYRPKALKSLFDLGLKLNDFPAEPIPITATIAHAIERVPVFIVENNKYEVLSYINKSELISSYFEKNLTEKNLTEKNPTEKKSLKINWLPIIFGISNNGNTIRITILFIKITIKMTDEKINKMAWWIPIRKWRDKFRAKFN